MGLPPFFGRSSSSYDNSRTAPSYQRVLPMPVPLRDEPASTPSPSPLSNPDPSRYDILRSEQVGKFLVVMLRYHGCTNYEGVKVMVYADCTLKQLCAQKRIDPHFAESKKFHSPIARFVPTEDGWEMAVNLCRIME